MIKKPEPYYKSLSDMREKCAYIKPSKLKDLTWFPCLECNGCGGVYDPNDRDPIEGYKMASKHPCKSCNGTGIGDKKIFTQKYKEMRKEYLIKLDKYKNSMIRIKEIKKIISEEDMELIFRQKHNYHYDY